MVDQADEQNELEFGSWVAEGQLLHPESGEALARVETQIWVMEPTEERAGKWGGSFRLLPPITGQIKPFDFQFTLLLDDGRRAEIFSELDLENGTGSIDGNGPPPG